MTKTKRTKLIIIISVSLFVVVGIIAGIVSVVKNQNLKEVETSAFSIGCVNSTTGMYQQSTSSIYTSELIACRGLTVTPDFESIVKYQVYFYDMNKFYLGCTEVLTTKYTLPKDDFESFYCRIVVYPEKDEYGYDPYVYFFNIPFIANNLKITVDKEQDISKQLKLSLNYRINTWLDEYINRYSGNVVSAIGSVYVPTEDDLSSITNFTCKNDVFNQSKFNNALNTAKTKIEKNAYEKFYKSLTIYKAKYYLDSEIELFSSCETLSELFNAFVLITEEIKGSFVYAFSYTWEDHGSGYPDPGITFDLEGSNRSGETWVYNDIHLNNDDSIKMRLKSGDYVLRSNSNTEVVFSTYDEYPKYDWVDENGDPSFYYHRVCLNLEYVSMGNVNRFVTFYTDKDQEGKVEHCFDSDDNYSVNISGRFYSATYQLLPELDDGDFIEFELRINSLSGMDVLKNKIKIGYKSNTTHGNFNYYVSDFVLHSLESEASFVSSNILFKTLLPDYCKYHLEDTPSLRIMILKKGTILYYLCEDTIVGDYSIISYEEVGVSPIRLSLEMIANTTALSQDYTFENLHTGHIDNIQIGRDENATQYTVNVVADYDESNAYVNNNLVIYKDGFEYDIATISNGQTSLSLPVGEYTYSIGWSYYSAPVSGEFTVKPEGEKLINIEVPFIKWGNNVTNSGYYCVRTYKNGEYSVFFNSDLQSTTYKLVPTLSDGDVFYYTMDIHNLNPLESHYISCLIGGKQTGLHLHDLNGINYVKDYMDGGELYPLHFAWVRQGRNIDIYFKRGGQPYYEYLKTITLDSIGTATMVLDTWSSTYDNSKVSKITFSYNNLSVEKFNEDLLDSYFKK